MNFREFWYGIPKPDRAVFAERCNSTEGYLNLLASGHGKAGESLAMRIERESAGQVLVETTRPDAPWSVVRGRPTPRAA